MIWQDGPVTVHIGDALTVLREMPAESVHTCITSPPYWGLRDYGIPGQLGLEPTPELYVEHMVEVFGEVRRVLRPDGTLWLNLGDSYAGSWGAQGRNGSMADRSVVQARSIAAHPQTVSGTGTIREAGLKAKDLVGIPWRLAFALQADGWWLRSDIVWAKPNPMPESVTDRPTKAHEYVFLLTKSARYYYDAEAVREVGEGYGRGTAFQQPKYLNGNSFDNDAEKQGVAIRSTFDGSGRNLRSVWTIATQPFEGAHFATFPEELVIPCIKAGTSERGCCPECGAPWRRIFRDFPDYQEWAKTQRFYGEGGKGSAFHEAGTNSRTAPPKRETIGWQPTCTHGREPVPCTVLDPFAGSGTTLAVARRLGRRAVGIELQADYLSLIQRRVSEAALPLLEAIQPAAQADAFGTP